METRPLRGGKNPEETSGTASRAQGPEMAGEGWAERMGRVLCPQLPWQCPSPVRTVCGQLTGRLGFPLHLVVPRSPSHSPPLPLNLRISATAPGAGCFCPSVACSLVEKAHVL